jgi:DNA-directed RNA polymerase I subunit RPA1
MSHIVRILPKEQTIRMHYANCSSYNADFDGDEMNIHLLQNHIARQEAYTICNTDNQYIIPTSGKPIRGLIQDSIVSAVFLTMKNTFFQKDAYYQLIYSSLESVLNRKIIKKIVTLPPAIIKPKQLWTGKQVISTILKSLVYTGEIIDGSQIPGMNMENVIKLSSHLWSNAHKLESTVIVRDNELMSGVLDINHIGNSESGILHSFYKIYEGKLTKLLISIFGRLFIFYL